MHKFYLDSMDLPLAPSKLILKIGNDNKTINLINIGEVNLLKLPKLTEISFDFHVVSKKIYDVLEMDIIDILSRLESLKTSKKPFRFIVSRSGDVGFNFDTNILVSLEDYTITEDSNLGSDILISVNLKQYKEYGFKTLKIVEKKQDSKTLTNTVTKASNKKAKIKNAPNRLSKRVPKRVEVPKGKMSVIEVKKATGSSRPMFLSEDGKYGIPMPKIKNIYVRPGISTNDLLKKNSLSNIFLGGKTNV